MTSVREQKRIASVPNPLSISVIVCAYTEDRWNQMLAAIGSLQSQTLRPTEIILVIDHNASLAARSRAAIDQVVIVENRENRGLSGARNTGIPLAKGEIIAFMDEDAIAAPDWLAQLAKNYADRQVVGVGGAIVPQWEAGRPTWFPEEFDWVVGCTYRGMPQTLSPVRNLIGCNMSFRREVFDVVGSFRNGIGRVGTRPVGCEETELCIRVRQHWPQKQMLYEPAAVVNHRVPKNRATWLYFRSRCYAEGLSKALVAHFVGAGDGLSSERSYTFRTLPGGVVRGLSEALHGKVDGFGRAFAIPFGLCLTGFGYILGNFELRRESLAGLKPEQRTI
jgi:glucosyl-dolichyl phosphate glucuronosyltransferase